MNDVFNQQDFKTHANNELLWIAVSQCNSTSALTRCVNARRVEYVEMKAPELQLIEYTVARYYDISSKADRGDILIVHD